MRCPNITGNSYTVGYKDTQSRATGAFAATTEWELLRTFTFQNKYGTYSSAIIAFDAHDDNATYGGASTVQPRALNVQYLIKY